MITSPTDAGVRQEQRVPKELASSNAFLLARLGARFKMQLIARLDESGFESYHYSMLAAGLIDLIVETEIKPYDIVAIIPIVAGAGGVITTWENKPAQGGGRVIVAGDKRVHQAALEILTR